MEARVRAVVKNIIVIFMRTPYITNIYNSIMNDKFMCLCFPEFSGKYICDATLCVFIHLSFVWLSLARYRGRPKRRTQKKVIQTFYWVIFIVVPIILSLSPSPPTTVPFALTKATCIDCPSMKKIILPMNVRMLSMVDRKISLKGHQNHFSLRP